LSPSGASSSIAGACIALTFAPFLPFAAQHVRATVRRVSFVKVLHQVANVSTLVREARYATR
jgi:hypothetical protein